MADDRLASFVEHLDGPSGVRFWLARVNEALDTLNDDELPLNYSRLQAKLDAVVASLGDDVANPWETVIAEIAKIRSNWGSNVRLSMREELQWFRVIFEDEIKLYEKLLAEYARQSKVVPLQQRRSLVTGSRSRAPRRTSSCSGRPRGGSSRVATSSRAGPDDSDGSSPPPELKFWRHPRYGSCNPGLLRVLLEVAI